MATTQNECPKNMYPILVVFDKIVPSWTISHHKLRRHLYVTTFKNNNGNICV